MKKSNEYNEIAKIGELVRIWILLAQQKNYCETGIINKYKLINQHISY